MKKVISYMFLSIILITCTACTLFQKEENDDKDLDEKDKPTEVIPEEVDVLVSAVGDCTLGTDPKFSYPESFPYYLDQNNNDYSYYFSKVADVFRSDDLTIANLETTFTTATERKKNKTYCFKGDPTYTNILTSSSIESVNLANNHTEDYNEAGYEDTINNLKKANLSYFGNGKYDIYEVRGIKIGLAGIQAWDFDTAKAEIDATVKYFDENPVNVIIYSFHWGKELAKGHNELQESIAHYAVDNGKAALILGHHPHVLQGIETYNGVHIVYSLGNFSFGGNKNPRDKRTMIFQLTFSFKNGEIIKTTPKIIPAFISGYKNKNNYQPVLATSDSDVKYVLNRIKDYSKNFEYDW